MLADGPVAAEGHAMPLFSLDELAAAAAIVRAVVEPTPAYAWPLLAEAVGTAVIVKHENHTPIGAFKIRGGLVYVDALCRAGPRPKGLVTATRGNHGQSIALAAARYRLPLTIVVPHGNSSEKNAAMAAFGAEVVTAGKDFDESRLAAEAIERSAAIITCRPFTATWSGALPPMRRNCFKPAHGDLDVVYVPIGLGSGICGLITVRDLLGLKTEIVGVVADNAPAYALSFAAGHAVETNAAQTFADGVACRVPSPQALDIILKGAARLVRVAEDEIAEAIRIYYRTTHNLAEGAGAVPLAAALKEKPRLAGKRVGLILSGGNIDRPVMAKILRGETPEV